MRSIQALSIAPEVNVWLANTRHPHILHVFDRACNLINEQREILSIVTSEIGNGPFNLVVEDLGLSSEDLQSESPVSILGNQLTVGDLVIDIAYAKCWSPRPDWGRLHTNREKITGPLTQLPIPNSQSPACLASGLSSALARGDVFSAKIISSQLAGLGSGLTPAGDDFIMGALYTAWMIHPIEAAEFLAMEVSNIAAPLTTSLSAAWLRAAGRGQAGIVWHEFLDAVDFPEPVRLQSAINKIMSIGDTSGTESLAGFIGTFHSYMEIKK